MKTATLQNIQTKPFRISIYGVGVTLTILVFCLISMGGLVRNAGGGLSCPDWPLCYGQLVPNQLLQTEGVYTRGQVFAEWFHRLLAGSASIGLLSLVFSIFLNPPLRHVLWKYCFLAAFLLGTQIVLGGLTVIGWLDPKWVASHLVVGLAFFGTVLWMTLRSKTFKLKPKTYNETKGLIPLVLIAAFLVYFQALLGGLVSSTGSGLACPDFPKCNGMWLPALEGGVPLQILHRVGAVLTTMVVVIFAAACFKSDYFKRQSSPLARFSLTFIPILMGLQILLGVSLVFYKIPLLMSVAHLALATALLGTLLVMYHELKYN